MEVNQAIEALKTAGFQATCQHYGLTRASTVLLPMRGVLRAIPEDLAVCFWI